MNYVNPLSRVTGLIAQRVDQGVDFTGHGPVLAMGKARILETNGSGWPGGPYMSYQLLDGQYAGRTVYVAESITPVVHPGQVVNAGETVATMHGFIETGWADSGGGSPLSQTAAAGSITGANLPPGGTQVGRNFESFLNSLGVPKGNNLGAAPGGKLPSGMGASPVSNAPANSGGGGLGGIFSWPSDITGFFGDAIKLITGSNPDGSPRTMPPWGGLLWLAQPSNWVRIVAFLAGVALLLFAVHAFIAAGKGEPLVKPPSAVPVPVPI